MSIDTKISFAQAMEYFRNTLFLEGAAKAMHELRLDMEQFEDGGVVLSPTDVLSLQAAFRDATEMISGGRYLAEEFEYLAEEQSEISLTDSMTSLGNRRAYDNELKRAQAVAARNPDKKVYILATDLRGLKAINDNPKMGERYGDAAIVAMAHAADAHTRENEAFFRTGGDEIKGILIVDKDVNTQSIVNRWRDDLSDIRVNYVENGTQFRIKTYQALVEALPDDTPDSVAKRAGDAINDIKAKVKADRTDLAQSIEWVSAEDLEVGEPTLKA
jgi:diguanylate cyclase (GGDEF)-like protein